jgi:hypothetical protein
MGTTLGSAGACCYDGGRSCDNYQARAVCDSVRHGTWFGGRSCAEGSFCPNEHGGAGELFGWQHDDRNKPLGDPTKFVSPHEEHWGIGKKPPATHSHHSTHSKPHVVRVKHYHQDTEDDDDDSKR